MTTQAFSLSSLDAFKAAQTPPGYPQNMRTFYSPVDDVPAVLRAVFSAAKQSLVLAYYGFNDPELADIVANKMRWSRIAVQLTLDSSQAGGVHERALLAAEDFPATSVAIGRSEKHAIMHLKLAIVDGLYVVNGSTNLGLSAETKQDNQLTVMADPYVAAEARARCDAIHFNILEQMHPLKMFLQQQREST